LISPRAALGIEWLASARCDVRWQAAVFVEPDETTSHEDLLGSHGFRRLLLKIGGANIAAAES